MCCCTGREWRREDELVASDLRSAGSEQRIDPLFWADTPKIQCAVDSWNEGGACSRGTRNDFWADGGGESSGGSLSSLQGRRRSSRNGALLRLFPDSAQLSAAHGHQLERRRAANAGSLSRAYDGSPHHASGRAIFRPGTENRPIGLRQDRGYYRAEQPFRSAGRAIDRLGGAPRNAGVSSEERTDRGRRQRQRAEEERCPA